MSLITRVRILQGMMPVAPPSELAQLNSRLELLERDSSDEVRHVYVARGLDIRGYCGVECMHEWADLRALSYNQMKDSAKSTLSSSAWHRGRSTKSRDSTTSVDGPRSGNSVEGPHSRTSVEGPFTTSKTSVASWSMSFNGSSESLKEAANR